MNAIASLAFGIASSLCACTGAVAVASLVLAEPAEPPILKTTFGPDLWTTTPVRIDRSRQNYERLPAVYSTYVTNPVRVKLATGRSIRIAPRAIATQAGPSTVHIDWCSNRYRSYDAATNAYRSYNGQMRTCVSPYANRQAIDKSRSKQLNPRFVGYGAENLRIARCAARYQSYRAYDNTYQPYDGPRRPCLPSFQDVRLEASNHW